MSLGRRGSSSTVALVSVRDQRDGTLRAGKENTALAARDWRQDDCARLAAATEDMC